MSFIKTILQGKDDAMPIAELNTRVEDYAKQFKETRSGVVSKNSTESKEDAIIAAETRNRNYLSIVKDYYLLATDLYEYGWGTSFHFGERHISESLIEAIKKSEYRLASYLGLRPNMHIMDVGCGVGGPARNITLFSGARVTGVNINEYQIKRAKVHTERAGLQDRIDYVQADFMHLTKVIPENSMDAAYAIEATVHAPSLANCYREIYKTLKPGCKFACYEWCLTDKYDPDNEEHRRLKLGIELGNGVTNLVTSQEVIKAVQEAGFQLIESRDTLTKCDAYHIPWYDTFKPKFTLKQFKQTPVGRFCLQIVVSMLEFVRIAPKGTTKIHRILMDNATCLARAGELGIFTPQFLFVGEKPL